uniref:RING-type domain-containing protein n=1 Tax=Panagrolaimus davidi TaxID=227884 RepID=A0A914Q2T2_9BILA
MFRPLSPTSSPENETNLEDEIAAVWNHICVVGMKDIIKDRKFMKGKCFNCSSAEAIYLLYPCYHLNRCDSCFRWENINNDIKCLLCGKRSNGFLDVMTGKTQ